MWEAAKNDIIKQRDIFPFCNDGDFAKGFRFCSDKNIVRKIIAYNEDIYYYLSVIKKYPKERLLKDEKAQKILKDETNKNRRFVKKRVRR